MEVQYRHPPSSCFIYTSGNKGADKTVGVHRLICTFIGRMQQSRVSPIFENSTGVWKILDVPIISRFIPFPNTQPPSKAITLNLGMHLHLHVFYVYVSS